MLQYADGAFNTKCHVLIIYIFYNTFSNNFSQNTAHTKLYLHTLFYQDFWVYRRMGYQYFAFNKSILYASLFAEILLSILYAEIINLQYEIDIKLTRVKTRSIEKESEMKLGKIDNNE